jgi:hypothetical protein
MILIDKVKNHLKQNPLRQELSHIDMDLYGYQSDCEQIYFDNIIVNFSIDIEQIRVREEETNGIIYGNPFIVVSNVFMYLDDVEIRLSEAQELHLISIIELSVYLPVI